MHKTAKLNRRDILALGAAAVVFPLLPTQALAVPLAPARVGVAQFGLSRVFVGLAGRLAYCARIFEVEREKYELTGDPTWMICRRFSLWWKLQWVLAFSAETEADHAIHDRACKLSKRMRKLDVRDWLNPRALQEMEEWKAGLPLKPTRQEGEPIEGSTVHAHFWPYNKNLTSRTQGDYYLYLSERES